MEFVKYMVFFLIYIALFIAIGVFLAIRFNNKDMKDEETDNSLEKESDTRMSETNKSDKWRFRLVLFTIQLKVIC